MGKEVRSGAVIRAGGGGATREAAGWVVDERVEVAVSAGSGGSSLGSSGSSVGSPWRAKALRMT